MTGLHRSYAVIFTCFLLQAGMAHAAAPAPAPEGLSREQTRQMIEDAQNMRQCFENIDHDALEKLAGEGRRAEAEIRSLCKAGKRDDAQARAMDYARKVDESEVIRAIRKCGTMSQSMMRKLPGMVQELEQETTSGHGHICDDM